MPLVLLALGGVFAAVTPEFLGPRNLSMLLIELSVTATLAVGMLVVILPGQIDLAAGTGAGLLGGVASVLVFRYGWPSPVALVTSFVLGVLIWSGMGAAIVRWRIQAFIVTLGGLLVFKGAFWLTIRTSTVPVTRGGEENLYALLTTFYLPESAGLFLAGGFAAVATGIVVAQRRRRERVGLDVEPREIAFLKVFVAAQSVLLAVLVCNQHRGVPLAFLVFAAIAAAAHVVTQRTPFGRALYAIGGNEEAAVVAGIPVARVVTTAFALMGGIVALTGFLQTAYAGASTVTVGEFMELDAVAACVIGGASLRGGRGTVLGTLFGAAIMATLLNGMTLLALAPELRLMARGVVLVLAVVLDLRLRRNR